MTVMAMVAATATGCMVGESGPRPADSDAGIALRCGAPADDYKACMTADAKAGWCVPQTGCVETCDDVSTACWSFSYAWPHDPEMQHDPICWCTDDEWLAPSER